MLLTACWPQENPPTVHVVHKGQLYEIEDYPDMTTACDLDYWEEKYGTELIEGTVIPANVMPSKEGEVNVNAESVQLIDGDNDFLVIIDGTQYIVHYQ